MDYAEIRFEAEGPIATITLNNPSKINALSQKMVSELNDVLSMMADNETVKVIVLKAAGKHFCAGHYLAEMTGKGAKEYRNLFNKCTEMMQLMHKIPQIIIAQVRGIATAAGCQLVAWSDMAVADDGAKFATPGVKIGLFCTTPMVAIARSIGRKAAMEMLMTGRYFSATEAKELGLINRVVSPENLEQETHELALQVIEASGFVLGIGKQAFYAQIDQPDDTAWNYAKHTIALNNLAEDAQNGITAFLTKSKATWANR
ncbi:MAG: enoyl-CoA hydratase [Desulfobacteraceae bacterium]|nr:enoyl-CoA hydratase [Desulfobacteraceae bacterium]